MLSLSADSTHVNTSNLPPAPRTIHPSSPLPQPEPFTLSFSDSINTPAPPDLQFTSTFDYFADFDVTSTNFSMSSTDLSVSHVATDDAPYIPDVPGGDNFYTDFLRELSLPNVEPEHSGA